MSKYSIYRIDHFDPVLVGKQRRQMGIILAGLASLSIPMMMMIHKLLKIGTGEANLITLVFFIGFYILLYSKLKARNNKIKIIGEIEFTKTCIKKQIGDSLTEITYDSIHSIDLQRHIPALTISESKSAFITYILSINYKNSHRENFVVSDKPVGKWHDLSITDTIKTIKKLHYFQD
jgi:hypothetical protein